jgi:hypothetical protein
MTNLPHNPYDFFEGQPRDKGLPTNAVKDKALFLSRQQQVLYKVSEESVPPSSWQWTAVQADGSGLSVQLCPA